MSSKIKASVGCMLPDLSPEVTKSRKLSDLKCFSVQMFLLLD